MRLVPGTKTAQIEVYIQVPDRAETIEEGGAGGLHGDTVGVEDKLETVGLAIAEVCSKVYSSAQKAIATSRPDELTLEFGVKIGGKTGIPFVTEGSVEGSFKIKAVWKAGDANTGGAAA